MKIIIIGSDESDPLHVYCWQLTVKYLTLESTRLMLQH